MNTEEFRRQLRHETEKWWTEGLINAELYKKIADRYQFDSLEQDASNRFITILMGLGGVLLGLGIITFVAANWQDWSRSFRVILLLSLFISVNLTGFYLWRRPADRKFQKLGHGLLLLGALILGANMALMSQMFHQSGNFYELLLVWGFGVLAMAYSLRLSSLGMLALLLLGWGYSLGWGTLILGQEANSLWQFVVRHIPLIASLLFIPLAYWCRSRAIFGLGAIIVVVSLVLNLRPLAGFSYGNLLAPGWIAALAFTLPPALLWGYHRALWQPVPQSQAARRVRALPPDPFQPIARGLALCFFSLLFYVFSFHWFWDVPPSDYQPYYAWDWHPLIDAVLLSIAALLGWMQLRHQFSRRWFQERAIHTGTIALMLCFNAAIWIWHFEVSPGAGVATLLFNLLLFLLAMGLVRDGLALSDRSVFWGGMVLLVLGIISRMLEYNTGLLLKSIVFALCGVGVMVAGLWFERNIRPRKVALPDGR